MVLLVYKSKVKLFINILWCYSTNAYWRELLLRWSHRQYLDGISHPVRYREHQRTVKTCECMCQMRENGRIMCAGNFEHLWMQYGTQNALPSENGRNGGMQSQCAMRKASIESFQCVRICGYDVMKPVKRKLAKSSVMQTFSHYPPLLLACSLIRSVVRSFIRSFAHCYFVRYVWESTI